MTERPSNIREYVRSLDRDLQEIYELACRNAYMDDDQLTDEWQIAAEIEEIFVRFYARRRGHDD